MVLLEQRGWQSLQLGAKEGTLTGRLKGHMASVTQGSEVSTGGGSVPGTVPNTVGTP